MHSLVAAAFALIIAGSGAVARAPEPCDMATAWSLYERAIEAREDFFLWDDLDRREAVAELRRFISRLTTVLDFMTDCQLTGAGEAELERKTHASLDAARRILHRLDRHRHRHRVHDD